MTAADRLLTFDVGGVLYALPIHGVLEVAESGRVACVPTLPRQMAGVINWHGDALPVVSPELLLVEGSEARESLETDHVLVVPDAGGETAQLGLPVDRVVGLVDGSFRRGSGDLVVERRRMRGRVVSVLDPRALLERAGRIVVDALNRHGAGDRQGRAA